MAAKKIIFLTGCVNPKGMSKTVLQDPQKRKQQYIDAIRFYISQTTLKILFVDNSNTDLSAYFLKEIDNKQVEILTFEGNRYDKSLGKGYGECELLEYAFRNSTFMNDADYIIKITGRLCVNNIRELITSMKKLDTVYAQRIRMDGMSCLSYFFGSPKSFLLEYFLPLKGNINDELGVYFEHVLYRAVLSWKINGRKFKEFYLPIQLMGQSGSTGKEYKPRKIDYFLAVLKYVYHNTPFYK